jgi:uncharacterized protein with HEPN domain
MKKDMRVYLAHILECIEKIERFTRGGKEEFLQEALIQDAVIRNLEVIGEASKRVENSYRTSHPQIPWRKMTALRDVLLIHDYEGVDFNKVWLVIANDLPPLKLAIAAVLPPLDQLERELAGEQGEE